jgi:hypothetical protein
MSIFLALILFLVLHIVINIIISNSISFGIEIKLLNSYNGFVIGISNDIEIISHHYYKETLRIGFFFFNITFIFLKENVHFDENDINNEI